MSLLRFIVAGCCALALGLGASAARADSSGDTTECNDAYVETQQLRRAGKLRGARLAALACARDVCSVTVRRDCSAWLEDIADATPSIVIEARDAASNEVTAVRVFIDDELISEHLDGQALPLDPGAHELRFEHAGQERTQRLLALEGQAYRRVSVRFEPARAELATSPWLAAPPLVQAPASPRAVVPADSSSLASTIPLTSYVFGGVGLASLSAFGILATSAYVSERDLRKECERACETGRVDAVRDRYLIADVALGVGVSSLVAAGALWAFSPPVRTPGSGKPDLQLDWRASGVSVSDNF